MTRMTRAEVLRKCLILFDAQRRVYSRGNAGLEALPGAEESFQADAEICRVLREMLREMESGVPENLMKPASVTYRCRMTMEELDELLDKARRGEDPGPILVPYGPLDKRPEPDVPKVVELREWQRIAAEKPPERLDFDEGDGA